jgi:hypothetical protein
VGYVFNFHVTAKSKQQPPIGRKNRPIWSPCLWRSCSVTLCTLDHRAWSSQDLTVQFNFIKLGSGFAKVNLPEESINHQLYQGCQMVYFHIKIPIWEYSGGPWNGKCWFIIEPFGILYGHLVHILYGNLVIVLTFGIFFPVLVYCNKKNLASLSCSLFGKVCIIWHLAIKIYRLKAVSISLCPQVPVYMCSTCTYVGTGEAQDWTMKYGFVGWLFWSLDVLETYFACAALLSFW